MRIRHNSVGDSLTLASIHHFTLAILVKRHILFSPEHESLTGLHAISSFTFACLCAVSFSGIRLLVQPLCRLFTLKSQADGRRRRVKRRKEALFSGHLSSQETRSPVSRISPPLLFISSRPPLLRLCLPRLLLNILFTFLFVLTFSISCQSLCHFSSHTCSCLPDVFVFYLLSHVSSKNISLGTEGDAK